jgi:hypothetical protein
VFPYLHLKQAAEHIKTAVEAPEKALWGYRDQKYYLPKIESTADSYSWELLRNIFIATFSKENVLSTCDPDPSVPTLENDSVAKNPALETVILRILDLLRSPQSATVRSTGLEKAEVSIKNQVDFVVLENIYRRDKDYSNLSISDFAISQGRRVEKLIKGTGKNTVVTPVQVGYSLAETLARYLPNKTTKNVESEPFVRFIFSILEYIAESRIDIETYQLPASFIEAPSRQLRSTVRRGPVIKTKAGVRTNLYIPLSFVKSSECAPMPETVKRQLTDVGAAVLNNLDTINKLPVKECNYAALLYKEYITFAYALSDEVRKVWRTEAKYPSNAADISEALRGRFPKIDLKEPLEFYTQMDEYLTDIKRDLKVAYLPVKEQPEEQRALLASVLKEIKDKRDSRVKTR